ncbi:hypothetical protein N431DRAFT_463515 [Stipitochalara longipes BDJ]|nr:hypothetical protein N431DRAFT_463515 [Stipitochalara longipes BDJ]
MSRGGKRNRKSKKGKQRNEWGPQTAAKMDAKREQDRDPSHNLQKRSHAVGTQKRDAVRSALPSSVFVRNPTGTSVTQDITRENTVFKLSARGPQEKKRGSRGKSNATMKLAKRARKRAKKAALEATKEISILNSFNPATESGQDVHIIQESTELSATPHENPSTQHVLSAGSSFVKMVPQSVLVDISGYVSYDGDQARVPSPLSHLRRLASLIPRQNASPSKFGRNTEEWLPRKDYPSVLVAKAIDDFCSYVDDILEQ